MTRHPSTMAKPGHLKEYGMMLEQTPARRAALSRAYHRNRNSTLHTIKAPALNWIAPNKGERDGND